MVACDIHPLANLRVLRYLTETLGVTEDAKNAWYVHWISLGLAALEAHLVRDGRAGRYCYGDTPGMADCLLVPQVFNAERFNVDLTPYPTVLRINAACTALAAVALAHPSRQIDAQ